MKLRQLINTFVILYDSVLMLVSKIVSFRLCMPCHIINLYYIFFICYIFNWLQENLKNSRRNETVDCSPTSGSELFHAREWCTVRYSCQVLYFFQNNVVPQFFNGMLCCRVGKKAGNTHISQDGRKYRYLLGNKIDS